MYGNPPPPPPPYAMLNGGYQYYPHDPYFQGPPQYYATCPRRRSNGCIRSCCRCICCCCCFLLVVLLLQLFTVFYFYHVYDPKIPSYTVEGVAVNALHMANDSTLTTDLHLSIRAENPNKKIAFLYGNDSAISIDYSDVTICAAKLPAFRQSHGNTTVIEVDLKGTARFEPVLRQDFEEDRKNHAIPLLVQMKIPVSVVLGDVPLREFNAFINCSMVVDGLSPNGTARIVSRETTFAVEF